MAVLKKYAKGSLVRLWGIAYAAPTNPLTAEKGALTTPTTKVIKYVDPSGNVVQGPAVTTPTTGVFYIDITVDQEGIWRYQANGDGSFKQGSFEVTGSEFE